MVYINQYAIDNRKKKYRILLDRRQKLIRNSTIPEKVIKQALEEMELIHRQQYMVMGSNNCAFFLDFYLPEYRIAIEVDGADHKTKKKQLYDMLRTRQLKWWGIKEVIRFDNEQMHNHLIAIHLINQEVKKYPKVREIKDSKVAHRILVDINGVARGL